MRRSTADNPRGETAEAVGGFWGSPGGTVTALDWMASIRQNGGMAKKPHPKLSDQLRQAIDASGLTRYQIAKETGIDESHLAKFYHGQRGLSMTALNALGECLQLTINVGRKPNK